MQNVLPLHAHQNQIDSTIIPKSSFQFQMDFLINKIKSLELHIKELGASKDRKVSFSLQEGIVFIPVGNILRCEANGNYTIIHVLNEKSIVISQTLKVVENKIGGSDFLRVHSGHLVNKTYISRLSKNGNSTATLSNGDTVPISRSKWKMVVEEMNSTD